MGTGPALRTGLMRRFTTVNLRAVLPARPNGFWNPLIDSLITRIPSTWEFFPSQIQAIRGRLLEDGPSFTLQMATGSGKTTLCETLLFDHSQRHTLEAAILLVPYRSLASGTEGWARASIERSWNLRALRLRRNGAERRRSTQPG